MGRLAVVVDFAMEADAQYPASTAFLATTVLESQRHPELSRTENDAVRATREFLVWAVNDAIERGELAADVDVSSLAETLLVVLCGVGFYIGLSGAISGWRPSPIRSSSCWPARSGGLRPDRDLTGGPEA